MQTRLSRHAGECPSRYPSPAGGGGEGGQGAAPSAGGGPSLPLPASAAQRSAARLVRPTPGTGLPARPVYRLTEQR